MKQIQVGIIGCGGIAYSHCRQLVELNEVRIAAVVDPVVDNRNKLCSSFKLEDVNHYESISLMFKELRLDAVVICSPHTLHFEQAVESLHNGCHVLIEKPMTCTYHDAENLIDIAEKNRKILQVSYQRHFEPAFLYMKETISSGAIGRLNTVTTSLYQDWKQLSAGTWRQSPQLSGGGMLMDSGSHIIDTLLWITGLSPVEINTQLEMYDAPVEIDSFSTVRFEQNVIAGLNVIGNAPCWHETYVVTGEKGALFFENGKILLRKSGEAPLVPELPLQTTNQDKSFIDAIFERHEVKVPGEFAKKVVRLTEMAYQSAGYQPT
ncbi:Gfo/Idh/MocA family protein [Alteribacillus sp. HJP-4]|uniref:Gfo/Idh/MocA family protein n=1 Tax=Alteribacillus sp. HJP-4 TaxID=2775394 RepID=UPI0035CCC8D6